MVLDRRTPVSAKYVFLNITGVVDTSTTQFTNNPFWYFWGYYYGNGTNTFIDLGFPSTKDGTNSILATDLPFDVTATVYDRLDHIAKDLKITPPKVETTKHQYLGVSNKSGAQNTYLTSSEPDKVNVKVTIRGAVSNLMKLAGKAVTGPTGYTRINFGSTSTNKFGLAILTTTDIANPTSTNAVTLGYFINNCRVISVGDFTNVDSQGYAEADFEIEGDATDYFGEYYDTQHSNAQNA